MEEKEIESVETLYNIREVEVSRVFNIFPMALFMVKTIDKDDIEESVIVHTVNIGKHDYNIYMTYGETTIYIRPKRPSTFNVIYYADGTREFTDTEVY